MLIIAQTVSTAMMPPIRMIHELRRRRKQIYITTRQYLIPVRNEKNQIINGEFRV